MSSADTVCVVWHFRTYRERVYQAVAPRLQSDGRRRLGSVDGRGGRDSTEQRDGEEGKGSQGRLGLVPGSVTWSVLATRTIAQAGQSGLTRLSLVQAAVGSPSLSAGTTACRSKQACTRQRPEQVTGRPRTTRFWRRLSGAGDLTVCQTTGARSRRTSPAGPRWAARSGGTSMSVLRMSGAHRTTLARETRESDWRLRVGRSLRWTRDSEDVSSSPIGNDFAYA